jgi:hypothetical protein
MTHAALRAAIDAVGHEQYGDEWSGEVIYFTSCGMPTPYGVDGLLDGSVLGEETKPPPLHMGAYRVWPIYDPDNGNVAAYLQDTADGLTICEVAS